MAKDIAVQTKFSSTLMDWERNAMDLQGRQKPNTTLFGDKITLQAF